MWGVSIEAVVVGIDPGITTGIAILDSNGELLNIWSRRNVRTGDIIRHIIRFGKPVVIATDVNRVPKKVKNIARKFGCSVYSPDRALPVVEKNRLAKLYAVRTKDEKAKDRHELDALAAAVKAFHMHQEFFNRVRSALERKGMQHLFKDVVELLLSDESENITNAINKLQKKK